MADKTLRTTQARAELVVANEATDGSWDPREFWTDEQVAEFNDRYDAAVKAGRTPPKD